MYCPRWELAGFDILDPEDKASLILEMVHGLIHVNLEEIWICEEENNPLPPIYQSGVVYFTQGRQDDWKDSFRVVESGGGSCNSLTAWRVAELQNRGIPAGPWIQNQIQEQSRGTIHVFHVILWKYKHPLEGECFGDGTTWECPSRTLGMQSTPYDDAE
jgi:hypothetical protein